MSAYDGARAAATLWQAREVHVIADYALLRVVVEGAVLAWWISSEPDPNERARRAYRVALDDLTNARNREQAAVRNAQTDEGREKRGAALAGVLRELDRLTGAVRDSRIAIEEQLLTPRLLKMPSLLVEAERRIDGAGDLGYSLLWSITSTTAHGSLTAVEQLSNMSNTGEPVAMSDPDTVGQFAAQAAHLLHAAHDTWNRYAGHSVSRTEPRPAAAN